MRTLGVIYRILVVSPLILLALYFSGRNGEWIENAAVEWGYVRDSHDRLCLALNVAAPSGILLESITAEGRNVTASWGLVNPQDSCRGLQSCPWLGTFQNDTALYLPFGSDPRHLFGVGRYTYLYEWDQGRGPAPSPRTLKVRFRNLGTQTVSEATRRGRPVLVPDVVPDAGGEPVVRFSVFRPVGEPASAAAPRPDDRPIVENLAYRAEKDGFVPLDPQRGSYEARLMDARGEVQDQVRGWIRTTPSGVRHIYTKDAYPPERRQGLIEMDAGVFFSHVWGMGFLFYLVGAAWVAGRGCLRWWKLEMEEGLERRLLSVFLGLVVLTYAFFFVGLLGLLYRWVVVVVLLALWLLGVPPADLMAGVKRGWDRAVATVLESPWVLMAAAAIVGMLFYNLCYCFLPATYPDGSGDIVNSYLPNIRDYARSHGFPALINNGMYGLTSQEMDVLRTAAFLVVGEPGIYLMSFVYILILAGVLYLLARQVFQASGGGLLVAVVLILSAHMFTESLHLGKHHVAVLASFMVFMYSLRYSDDDKKYFLPGLCLGFVAAQYIFFLFLALAYYGALGVSLAWTERRLRGVRARQYGVSALVFALLTSVFHVKLILEVGTCFPPQISPAWISDVFLTWNRDNPAYRYIDNNAIRHFAIHNELTDVGTPFDPSSVGMKLKLVVSNIALWGRILAANLDYWPVLLLLPCLKGWTKPKVLFILATAASFLMIAILLPRGVRQMVYFIFPLGVLQFAILHDGLARLTSRLPAARPGVARAVTGTLAGILAIGFALVWVTPREGRGYLWLREAACLGIMQNPIYSTHNFRLVRHVFTGWVSKYEYLKMMEMDYSTFRSGKAFPDSDNFDYAMLARQHIAETHTVLIVPVRFHSHFDRRLTALHALGTVIYQEKMDDVMKDLKALGITHLSVMPILYKDYSPFYARMFEDDTFSRYFQLVFRYKGRCLYRVVYDGSNRDYTPSPYDVRGRPFIPMEKKAGP